MKRKAMDATPMIAKTQGAAPTHHRLFHILMMTMVMSLTTKHYVNCHDIDDKTAAHTPVYKVPIHI